MPRDAVSDAGAEVLPGRSVPPSRAMEAHGTLTGQSPAVPLAQGEEQVGREITLFLCGDVMLGRGVDQILPHPGDPTCGSRQSATPAPMSSWPSGARPGPAAGRPLLAVGRGAAGTRRAAPDVRIVNLETSVTRGDEFAPGKEVHYRMSPANLPALAAARRMSASWRTTTS